MPLLQAGAAAPDVSFRTHDRQEVFLSAFKGKQNVVIAFCARAFTGG